jgi:hypothetical protein
VLREFKNRLPRRLYENKPVKLDGKESSRPQKRKLALWQGEI